MGYLQSGCEVVKRHEDSITELRGAKACQFECTDGFIQRMKGGYGHN